MLIRWQESICVAVTVALGKGARPAVDRITRFLRQTRRRGAKTLGIVLWHTFLSRTHAILSTVTYRRKTPAPRRCHSVWITARTTVHLLSRPDLPISLTLVPLAVASTLVPPRSQLRDIPKIHGLWCRIKSLWSLPRF